VRGLWLSVTAGTIFQDTRTPLPVWFRAMLAVTSQKNGVWSKIFDRAENMDCFAFSDSR
jgi:hypothetical protein